MIANRLAQFSSTKAKMKNLQIIFSGKFLAIFLFSCGGAKKTCKPGQEDVLQQFYRIAHGKSTVQNFCSSKD